MLSSLTDEQRILAEAIASDESVRCDAVAGSGKTTAIIEGLRQCLGTTATIVFNKTTQKDIDKLGLLPVIKTSHAIGYQVIKEAKGITHLKINGKKTFNLCRRYYPEETGEDDLLSFVQFAKEQGYAPQGHSLCTFSDVQGLKNNKKVTQAMLDRILNSSINEQHEYDFSDLLYMPIVLGYAMPQFKQVVIDESQDFSPLQIQMVKAMNPQSVVAVGDPRQAIYGWRGASQDCLDLLEERYELARLRLTCSFRCSVAVGDYVRQWEPLFRVRPDAPEGWVEEEDLSFGPQQAVLGRRRSSVIKAAHKAIRQNKKINIGRNLNDLFFHARRLKSQEGLDAWFEENPIEYRRDIHEILTSLAPNALKTLDELTKHNSPHAPIFTTIHQAKGREWKHVHVLSHRWKETSDEETNLKYVACTRAINTLGLGS